MRIIIAAALLAFATPLAAQETRSLPEGHEPPPASIEDAAWLEGQWVGTGINGNRSMESWLPPVGDTMVGTFVQTNDEGGILFTEHLYLMEEGDSLVLRLKHFNADLTGWEDAEGMVTFRLIEIEPCAAYFGGLTIRCDGEDGLLAAVRMRSSNGEVSELVFNFTRVP